MTLRPWGGHRSHGRGGGSPSCDRNLSRGRYGRVATRAAESWRHVVRADRKRLAYIRAAGRLCLCLKGCTALEQDRLLLECRPGRGPVLLKRRVLQLCPGRLHWFDGCWQCHAEQHWRPSELKEVNCVQDETGQCLRSSMVKRDRLTRRQSRVLFAVRNHVFLCVLVDRVAAREHRVERGSARPVDAAGVRLLRAGPCDSGRRVRCGDCGASICGWSVSTEPAKERLGEGGEGELTDRLLAEAWAPASSACPRARLARPAQLRLRPSGDPRASTNCRQSGAPSRVRRPPLLRVPALAGSRPARQRSSAPRGQAARGRRSCWEGGRQKNDGQVGRGVGLTVRRVEEEARATEPAGSVMSRGPSSAGCFHVDDGGRTAHDGGWTVGMRRGNGGEAVQLSSHSAGVARRRRRAGGESRERGRSGVRGQREGDNARPA